jgi:hypothetical protein
MDYARAAAKAKRSIEKSGRDATFERLDATAADADKPWKGPAAVTVAQSVTQKSVFLPHNGNEDLGKFFVSDDLLKRCEQVLMTFVGATDLTGFHRVKDGNVVWKIEWVRELKPGPSSLLYAMGVSR